ncbi:MAG TPA: hypothetical protein VKA43_16465 [Gammaproteobacteria bacterium]|nr:hypothetical protein [Gammaproteobacteria bacterium]
MLIRIRLAALALCLVPHFLAAQVPGVPERPLPDGPFVIDTAERGQVRVTVTKASAFVAVELVSTEVLNR